MTRYRIIQTGEDQGARLSALGLAFEHRNRVFIWYPPMRGPLQRQVTSVDLLTEADVPQEVGRCSLSQTLKTGRPFAAWEILKWHVEHPDKPVPEESQPSPEEQQTPGGGSSNSASGSPVFPAASESIQHAERSGEPVMPSSEPVASQDTIETHNMFSKRAALYLREKRCIAEYVAWWLRTNFRNNAIAIDGGSTNTAIVSAICRDAIRRSRTVGTIITNNVDALYTLSTWIPEGSNPRPLATGGILRGSRFTLVGESAVNSLENAAFAVAIVGANGFEWPELSTGTPSEHDVKKKMIEGSRQIVFPIEADKWGLSAGSPLGSLDQLARDGKRVQVVTALPLEEAGEVFSEYNDRLGRLAENANRLVNEWIRTFGPEGIRAVCAVTQLPSESMVVPEGEMRAKIFEGGELRDVDFLRDRVQELWQRQTQTDSGLAIAFELSDPASQANRGNA